MRSDILWPFWTNSSHFSPSSGQIDAERCAIAICRHVEVSALKRRISCTQTCGRINTLGKVGPHIAVVNENAVGANYVILGRDTTANSPPSPERPDIAPCLVSTVSVA